MALERLQKILARAGVSSRRHAEQLLLAGRVRVNGKVVTELGTRADPFEDKIEVDGRRAIAEAPVYVIMHKPRAVVSTASDPEGRTTVTDLVSGIQARLYPVGRLDFQTSGALLLTNDGEFAAALLHPSRKVTKRYLVKLEGEITEPVVQRWRSGVVLDDGAKTLPAEVRVVRVEDGRSWLEVDLHEGRNQQIRRMGTATGFEVLRLTRLEFAGISIDGLRPGGWRLLTPDELRKMRDQYGVPRRVRPAIVDENDLPGRSASRRDTAHRGGMSTPRSRPSPDRTARSPRRDQDSPRDFDRKAPPRDDRPRDDRPRGKKPPTRRDQDSPRDFDRKAPPRD
ncbi:MAG TPA: pseudouridine synthase, partial [Polyangiaceae bacterium]|nr:pseudouridine synthase [Polyangiaceae bacterium]